MKKQTLILMALSLTLAMPTFAQKAMTKKEIAEKEKIFKALQHPWKGKRVAYFGDSITDPRNNGSKKKYWGFLEDMLGITPYVYGVSGREWNDIPRQADKLKEEHGDDFDAILILMGTNDYNHGYPSPSPLRDGQEHLERTHQHRHVKAQADVSQQANRADDTYPSCHLRP